MWPAGSQRGGRSPGLELEDQHPTWVASARAERIPPGAFLIPLLVHPQPPLGQHLQDIPLRVRVITIRFGDRVEKDMQETLLNHRGIELAHPAGCRITRVGEWLQLHDPLDLP
jgi:hypothetical protein